MDACPFCAIAAGQVDADLVAWRSTDFVIVPALKQRPRNRGHMLVVPVDHVVRPTALDAARMLELVGLTGRVADAVRVAFGASGVMVFHNDSVPEQGIEHLHVHVLPRTPGDGFRMPEPASQVLGAAERRAQAAALRAALARD